MSASRERGATEGAGEGPFPGVPFLLKDLGASYAGQPAISLPLHWSEGGLPIGVQLSAPFGREDVLIAVAAQLERAQPWSERTPPVWAQ